LRALATIVRPLVVIRATSPVRLAPIPPCNDPTVARYRHRSAFALTLVLGPAPTGVNT